ncbi:bifunctional helix-turn-helix transcriptional regulator/GNAT family N-acetyltransferase [Mucilaginibacter sp. X5P1]|uniref:bifunctional helix-turn-helix transcriptional regulator/GNAT family N-acetyltransferase n=1 Tax=Mucilaginibacter sp. X5P1 TaxID=2723088 RepID=UPI00160F7B14|nr:GNAT family N-acetyltransferase [Mucilaginibacter sp. X5P1]MBB6140074.1 DNA-binding MarR family transcriptional regulator/N-acetylglutamate synthase-like GNAT family acetyltransferase [Mucilaginibacter sp. X5P1]
MEFYNKTGKMALGSRLRRLSELITEQAGKVYGYYDIDMQPKWFPVFYVLSAGEEKSITQIAQEIGHSHPSVSTIVKEMMKRGLVQESPGKTDGRKNYIKLSAQGLAINDRIRDQYTDVNAAIENALNETQYNIWKAIEEWEFLLEQKDLLKRVQDERKLRERKEVEVVAYHPKYQTAFKQLNEDWISQYFKMEAADYKSLDHPKEYILDKGGHILIALYKGEPVGTCALIKMDDDTFELAKMAVGAGAKGKGIGWILGTAAIEMAKQHDAKKLYLESNTILKPAINLYHKLGFKKVTGEPSPYERCNIQMELNL